MNCPKCGGKTVVIDSRSKFDGLVTKRRRRCTVCGERYNTTEEIDNLTTPDKINILFDKINRRQSLQKPPRKRAASPKDKCKKCAFFGVCSEEEKQEAKADDYSCYARRRT